VGVPTLDGEGEVKKNIGDLVTSEGTLKFHTEKFFVEGINRGESTYTGACLERGEIGTVLGIMELRALPQPDVILKVLTPSGIGWIYEDWLVKV